LCRRFDEHGQPLQVHFDDQRNQLTEDDTMTIINQVRVWHGKQARVEGGVWELHARLLEGIVGQTT